jgi:tetratricopeptide (TPR) repeat protein
LNTLLPLTDKRIASYVLIGESYRQLGQSLQAKSAYRQALALDPDNAELNYQLSLWAASEGDFQEAVDYLKVAAFAANAADLFAQIAQTYGGMQQFDSAAVYTRRALNLGGASPALVGQLAFHYSTAGMLDSAKTTLLAGLEDFPNEPRLWAQLVEVYEAGGEIDSMRSAAQRMLNLQTNDHAVFERIGQKFISSGHMEDAENFFAKALEINPTSTPALFYLGRLAAETNRLEDAVGYFSRLREAEPQIPDGWINQALVIVRQGDTTQAISLLTEGLLSVQIERGALRFALAQLLVDADQSDSALTILKGVILEGGDSIRALFNVGAIHEQNGRFDEAVNTFELLLSIDPDHSQALNYLGYMFADRNVRLQESLDLIERALAVDSNSGAFIDSYAWVLYRLGRYEESLVQIRKAIELIPVDDPIVTEHLGDIHFALGNVAEARAAWQAALELDPDNDALREKIARHVER